MRGVLSQRKLLGCVNVLRCVHVSAAAAVAAPLNNSYINMLHLYESLGWWRRSMEARKVRGRAGQEG